MDSRFHHPKKFFQKTKDRFGPLMEEYHTRVHTENRLTDFAELEELRNQSRTAESRYDLIYQFFLSGGVLLFIYYFLKLAQEDLVYFFYNF